MIKGEELTFIELAIANRERCEKSFHILNEWSPSDWSNAMAGECGEVCNLNKKIRRGDSMQVSLVTIGHEIADTVIYADLLAQRLGLDLGELIQVPFNAKSDEIGSLIKI